MPFEMSPKAKLEEGLIEVVSFLQNVQKDFEEVLNLIKKNEQIDRQNDKMRREVNGFLNTALRAHNAHDMNGVHTAVHAAIQRLGDQEVADYQDDAPRTEALIKIATFMQRAIRAEEKFKVLIKEASQVLADRKDE